VFLVTAFCRADRAGPGGKLASLRQAIAHQVKTVPPAERGLPAVLTAAELLTNAAEHGGPIEFARIASLQALNRPAEHVFNPSAKARPGRGAN
jgi:hypothetical protein